ncbi:MAG: phage shock protein operon transcriptional activator [Verrucomicrobiota bacterium]|nr:phage shock protein operon transcriptional activator [Verrucomicrobiota bacterium]
MALSPTTAASRHLPVRSGPPEAIGRSDAFVDFQARLSRVAKVERPVLIMGERGTGKELAAARLHFLSKRWQGPLVALNCAALAPSLLESELFGHEAGAFTGAMRRREGRFETAAEGTLFLDEVGLLPMEVQEKILRAVEYRTFERVGGTESVSVNVRIIGATNADLPAMAAEGKFKPDLLDRLSFEVLFIPPLRARQGDILLLARHFAARMSVELGMPGIPQFSEEAVKTLEEHPWPGNVRELKNTVERAIYQCDGEWIDHINFDPFQSPFAPATIQSTTAPVSPAGSPPAAVASSNQTSAASVNSTGQSNTMQQPPDGVSAHWQPGKSINDAVDALERNALILALKTTNNRQGEAAQLLGLTYTQFRNLLRRHPDAFVKTSARKVEAKG